MANPLCNGRKADCEDTSNAETNKRSKSHYSCSLVDLLHDSNRTAVTIQPVGIDPHSAGARRQIVW